MTEQQRGKLSLEERDILLKLAREAVTATAENKPLPVPDLEHLPPALREPAACFVTLHRQDTGDLRGCTGVLVAQSPLAIEVVRTAAQTARRDPRFPPVAPNEVDDLEIEISILTPPQPLEVPNPEDLPRLIRPGIDGVTLYRPPFRATFLPQVWQTIPDPVEFLDMLSLKMGLTRGAWRLPGMRVEVYQVEEFSDKKPVEG